MKMYKDSALVFGVNTQHYCLYSIVETSLLMERFLVYTDIDQLPYFYALLFCIEAVKSILCNVFLDKRVKRVSEIVRNISYKLRFTVICDKSMYEGGVDAKKYTYYNIFIVLMFLCTFHTLLLLCFYVLGVSDNAIISSRSHLYFFFYKEKMTEKQSLKDMPKYLRFDCYLVFLLGLQHINHFS